MTPREGEPLWREVVGETEPWRRGRLFVILLAILAFCLQILSLGYSIAVGDIEQVLVQGIFALIFWLQFYFIWIGVHWVRWLNGGWSALWGFALVIWGLRDGATIAVGFGFYSLAAGCYLAFAPSVYFFAKRQRESIRWLESLVIAVVFLLLLGSLVAGALGLLGYRAHLEQEARKFADTAFKRIFSDHDTYFLLEHASDELLKASGGRAPLTRFLQGATMRAGDVRNIEPSAGGVRFWYQFPSHLGSVGQMSSEGAGDKARVRMHLLIRGDDGGWQIDGIRWYPVFAPTPPP